MSRSNRPEDYLCKPGAIKTNRSIPGNRHTWIRFPYKGDSRSGYVTYLWHLYDFTIKWDINYCSAPGPYPGQRKFYKKYETYRMMNWAKCGIKGDDDYTEYLRKGKCPPGMKDVCPKCREIWITGWKKPVFKSIVS